MLNILSILLHVKLDLCITPFNCAFRVRVNCHYFNRNDLGICELSQTGTLDCFLNEIWYDFRCRTEPVTFGAP
jgi:hypothetical protein